MKEITCNKTYNRHIIIKVLGVTALALLMLVGIAGAAPFAYITNQDSNTVSVIDIATDTIKATVDVGSGPVGVAVSPDGLKVYVTNCWEGTVSVIDTATNTVTATVYVESMPFGVAFTPDGSNAYVSNWGSNDVSVIDTATNTVTATVPVGTWPEGIVVTPDGKRGYIANAGSDDVSVIEIATNTVTATIPVGDMPQGVAVNPNGKKLYVTNGGSRNVSVIDTAANTVTYTVPVEDAPSGIVVSPDGTKVYVANTYSNTVSVIDSSTSAVTATVNMGEHPYGVSVSPDGTKVYVVNGVSNTVSVIDADNNSVTATVPVGYSPRAFGQFIGTPPVQPEVLKINDFTAKITTGKAPLRTEFISDVTGTNIIKWRWDFEPPGKDYYSQHAVTAKHTFTKPGVYDITLTVWDAAGNTDTMTKPGYIVVNPAKTVKKPVANFCTSVTYGKAPLTVKFVDKSINKPTSWYWDFGDKTTSKVKNPVHKYTNAGKYSVNLTVSNAAGSNTMIKTNYITVR